MFKDDDDEEDNTFGVTRYPCMPSLVALQQMRNRLHLANLGKKLMKWTALATGTELRHIAGQLDNVYKSFSEDMRNAYILLARCRYFYPNLNKMVVEGCPSVPGVLLSTTTKTASGVKVIKYEIIENKTHPYEHLGIEKGGQTIQDTKKAWLDLLKRIILMVELRTNFRLVETMHKTANKKMNVLGKVVIPKTKATCAYIISALEEFARDEFYRRKMILEVKEKEKSKVDKKAGTSKESTLKCDDTNDDSLLTLLKNHIDDILQTVNNIDGKTLEECNIQEFLSLGEGLKKKLDAIVKSEPILSKPSSDCYICAKNSLESVTRNVQAPNSEIIPQEPQKNVLPLENYHKTQISNEFIDTNSNLGGFVIEVKEITKIVRIRNKDGTIKEEKKVIKITKEIRDAGAQSLPQLCTSNYSSVSKDDTISNKSYFSSGSSSKTSHSRDTTINMISVNDWINRKLINKSLYDQKYLAQQINGETSKTNASMYYGDVLFDKNSSQKFGEEYLKLKDYSSSNSVTKYEQDILWKIENNNLEHTTSLLFKVVEAQKSEFTSLSSETNETRICQDKSNEVNHTENITETSV